MISAETPLGRHQVYVMMGEVLAAHTAEDAPRVVELLSNARAADAEAIERVRVAVGQGGSLSEALFDAVAEDVVTALLHERFRENLLQFLAGGEALRLTPMDAVFTDNIQVGHDSRALVEELAALAELVRAFEPYLDVALVPGPRAAERRSDGVQRAIVSLAEGGRALYEVLRLSPRESGRTLAVVRTLLDSGVVRFAESTRTPPRQADPEAEVAAPAAAREGRRGADEPFDELAAFQDYDTSRMGGDFTTERALLDRVEVTDAERAPFVPLLASTETVIEMEEADAAARESGAISLNFSGPKLHDDEAARKLEVLNDVCATVCAALDAVDGSGAGQAQLQLLIEGSSGAHALLFKNVEPSLDGRLPIAQVLKNLRRRPATEQRRLLDRALGDLIERALGAAGEALDEPRLESMLERIAGYQHRLGM